jgi:hypothetical protein
VNRGPGSEAGAARSSPSLIDVLWLGFVFVAGVVADLFLTVHAINGHFDRWAFVIVLLCVIAIDIRQTRLRQQ